MAALIYPCRASGCKPRHFIQHRTGSPELTMTLKIGKTNRIPAFLAMQVMQDAQRLEATGHDILHLEVGHGFGLCNVYVELSPFQFNTLCISILLSGFRTITPILFASSY